MQKCVNECVNLFNDPSGKTMSTCFSVCLELTSRLSLG